MTITKYKYRSYDTNIIYDTVTIIIVTHFQHYDTTF